MRAGWLDGERGSVSAEQGALVAVVAVLVAAVWAAAVPQRVADAGAEAADCLFTTLACDLSVAGGADGQRPGSGPGPQNDSGAAAPVGAAAEREAAVDRRMRDEARALRDLADRELRDLAVWDELQALEVDLGDPTRSDERRAADLERYEALRAQLAAAPDGSVLAELRDTEAARRDPFRSPDDNGRLLAVIDRIERARNAHELADLLEEWAASDRRFVHVEVDLDDGTARVAEVVRGDLDAADHVAVVVPGTGSDAAQLRPRNASARRWPCPRRSS